MSDWLISSRTYHEQVYGMPATAHRDPSPTEIFELRHDGALSLIAIERQGEPIEQPLTVPMCSSCLRLLAECNADLCAARQPGRVNRRG
jgi:hypothetical protein